MDTFTKMISVVGFLTILVSAIIWQDYTKKKDFDIFKQLHSCRLVGDDDDKKQAWQCNDGVTYWRAK